MCDGVFVEAVFGKAIFACAQCELARRYEGQQPALACAVRAVATHHAVDLGLDIELNLAAVATAGAEGGCRS